VRAARQPPASPNLFIDTTALDGRLQANLDYWVNSDAWQAAH